MKVLDKVKKKKHEPPAPLPDTAQDMYGEPSLGPSPTPVSAPPPEPAPSELPKIDFKKQERKIVPEPARDIEEVPVMEDEIKLFEDAVSSYSGFDDENPDYVPEPPSEPSEPKIKASDQGFFSEFQRFLEGNDVPAEINSKEMLEKMKEYHAHKEQGKDYYLHTSEMKNALNTHLNELRKLEAEWHGHKENLSREKAIVEEKEKEISEKLEGMKKLIDQIKDREEFSKLAPDERYFKMANGQTIKSLSDLATALRVMDDDVFSHHVRDNGNDFADWVGNVFGKSEVYNSLTTAKSKDEMIKALTH